MAMDNFTELFDKVQHQISVDARHMMEELWQNWTHLGVDEDTKINNTEHLVQIERELHRDVISETLQKLKTMQDQIDKLKAETEELSACLSLDISIPDYRDDMVLSEYKKELEDQIAGYREQVQQRRVKMNRLLEWQRDLVQKLGVTFQELKEVPLPAEEELDKLKTHLEKLQSLRDERVETFLNAQVEVKDIMDKLQIRAQNKFEHAVVSSLSVNFQTTDLNMDRLAKLRQDLQLRYDHTNNRVLELRERLTRLWECLEEDRIYRDNFLQAHQGCHPHAESAIKEEIKRCELIKRQKIQVFVANIRTKIKLMWDSVMYDARERDQFVHYYQDVFTEDTLTLHELYLDKITKYYNDNKNIFELVSTRKALWLKMSELEARATEPGRYHNRGGQLLKEEKERKAIASKLPKIEDQLRELVSAYEASTGQVFTAEGKPLLQLIADEWEARKAERHNKVSARRQGLTPTTPLLRSLATSPLGKRSRAAAGLNTATPIDNKLRPPRRPLVSASASRAAVTLGGNMSALKRSAMSTVKRRISGRVAARVAAECKGELVKRKLDYGGVGDAKKHKATANGSILKHKRTSRGRRSSSRQSLSATQSSQETELQGPKDVLMETTLLTTYTDFKDRIHEKQISRSSLVTGKDQPQPAIKICAPIEERHTPSNTPKNTPLKHHQAAMTPKFGKENIELQKIITPKPNSLLYTPNRLTRSAVKLNGGFATPRAPFSANKPHLHSQRQNGLAVIAVNSPPISRSKSHSNLVRVKALPPLI